MRPPNLSKDNAGYNTSMFKTDRSVKNAFRRIGYGVSPAIKVPSSTITQFQHDYNKCGDKFGRWGKIDVTSKLDKHTLNALEIAVRWSVKRENRDGVPAARSWQGLCRNLKHLSCNEDQSRSYSATEAEGLEISPDETRYIEILPNGNGKLRNLHSDHALRANILDFEHHGPVIFAVAILPPQDGLPGGREEPFSCPCVFR